MSFIILYSKDNKVSLELLSKYCINILFVPNTFDLNEKELNDAGFYCVLDKTSSIFTNDKDILIFINKKFYFGNDETRFNNSISRNNYTLHIKNTKAPTISIDGDSVAINLANDKTYAKHIFIYLNNDTLEYDNTKLTMYDNENIDSNNSVYILRFQDPILTYNFHYLTMTNINDYLFNNYFKIINFNHPAIIEFMKLLNVKCIYELYKFFFNNIMTCDLKNILDGIFNKVTIPANNIFYNTFKDNAFIEIRNKIFEFSKKCSYYISFVAFMYIFSEYYKLILGEENNLSSILNYFGSTKTIKGPIYSTSFYNNTPNPLNNIGVSIAFALQKYNETLISMIALLKNNEDVKLYDLSGENFYRRNMFRMILTNILTNGLYDYDVKIDDMKIDNMKIDDMKQINKFHFFSKFSGRCMQQFELNSECTRDIYDGDRTLDEKITNHFIDIYNRNNLPKKRIIGIVSLDKNVVSSKEYVWFSHDLYLRNNGVIINGIYAKSFFDVLKIIIKEYYEHCKYYETHKIFDIQVNITPTIIKSIYNSINTQTDKINEDIVIEKFTFGNIDKNLKATMIEINNNMEKPDTNIFKDKIIESINNETTKQKFKNNKYNFNLFNNDDINVYFNIIRNYKNNIFEYYAIQPECTKSEQIPVPGAPVPGALGIPVSPVPRALGVPVPGTPGVLVPGALGVPVPGTPGVPVSVAPGALVPGTLRPILGPTGAIVPGTFRPILGPTGPPLIGPPLIGAPPTGAFHHMARPGIPGAPIAPAIGAPAPRAPTPVPAPRTPLIGPPLIGAPPTGAFHHMARPGIPGAPAPIAPAIGAPAPRAPTPVPAPRTPPIGASPTGAPASRALLYPPGTFLGISAAPAIRALFNKYLKYKNKYLKLKKKNYI